MHPVTAHADLPTRRAFLKQTAATGLGAAALGLGALPASSLRAAEAEMPFKFAKCNETFVDWPFEKVCRFVAECGYTGLEIAPFTIATYVTEVPGRRRARLRRQMEEAGLQSAGLHWLLAKTEGLHLTHPDPQIRKKTADYLAELANFCADLGGDVMIFGSPKQRDLLEGVSRDQGMAYAAEVLKSAMPVMEKRGVTLALEPLGEKETNFIPYAADAVELAEMVDSPRCKMMLDCKAMVHEADPMPALIRRYQSWMVHFHANDPNLRGPGMGELDFVPLFEALFDVNFDRWVSVEVFDYEPGPEALARESIAYMKECVAKVQAARRAGG
jgi:sugar phosphate isomerase/epimerase